MTLNLLKRVSQIESNIRVHDKIAKKYEQIHGEIYNEIEQSRLKETLQKALSYIRTENSQKLALDFGCGAGNLTAHLTQLGCHVLACDVSQGFLDLVQTRKYPTSVKSLKLNGIDLSNVADGTVDIVATYSVLHHVPKYIDILAEFVRVLKPGGVIFIDHELSSEIWAPTSARSAFLAEMPTIVDGKWKKYFRLQNYIDWFILKFINPRYQTEGDIHVFKDDHIEWDKVATALVASGADIISESDYLLFKRGYDSAIYEKFKDKTSDMHFLIARKHQNGGTDFNLNGRRQMHAAVGDRLVAGVTVHALEHAKGDQ